MQPAGGQSSEAFGASTTMVRLRHGIEIDDDALREVCERNHVRELAIFGSALRSDFDTDSDIDVLVEFEPGVPIGMIALGRLQRELSTLIGRQVDLVPEAGLKPAIREAVLAGARVVYAA